MNAHHHHEPKLSRNQGQVLAALRKAKEPLSAYSILDRVRASGISHPPTVYRALNELIQLAEGDRAGTGDARDCRAVRGLRADRGELSQSRAGSG
jgi:hypothetical protein